MTVAEIQPYRDQQALPAIVPDSGYAELASWAMSAQAAYSVAEKLVQTSFVPEAFRNKPHEATAAILSGAEVGLNPMASLRSFDIIQGTAAPRALTMRAIVQSKGHEVWSGSKSATRVVMYGRRKGSTAPPEEVEWTIARARDLGLTGKSNWKTQPQTMLIARATSEVCRLIAADALLGIPYSAEELRDGLADEPATDEPAPQRTTARRARARAVAAAPPAQPAPVAAQPAADPPLPGEDGYIDQDTPLADASQGEDTHGEPQAEPDRPLSSKQRGMILALFGSAGINDRSERLEIARRIVGLPELASANDLTLDQASLLIDRLQEAEQHEGGFSAWLNELITATEAGATAADLAAMNAEAAADQPGKDS